MTTPLILWCTPYMVGGVTTFAANLHLITGWPVVRLARRHIRPAQKIPGWPVEYYLRTEDDLFNDPRPIILAGGTWTHEEEVWHRLDKRKAGMYWVFHDPTEFKSMPHTRALDPTLCIVLRESNLAHQPLATLVPQPYQQVYTDVLNVNRYRLAVSTARVDGLKQTHLLVDANRELPEHQQVVISGSPNRMYVHGRKKTYPELCALTSRPAGFGSGADLCRTAEYSVDLTNIAGDGGGLQYTTLEAIDAGAVPVIWSKWMSKAGPMHNLKVLQVSSAKELIALLKSPVDAAKLDAIRTFNKRYLQLAHAPAILKTAYNSLF